MAKVLDSIEKSINAMAEPLEPYLPTIARFLLVVTWLEDSLRIVTQWNEQVHYIEIYGRKLDIYLMTRIFKFRIYDYPIDVGGCHDSWIYHGHFKD